MDFWNILIEVGPSTKMGSKAPRHHQRGVYDGRTFGVVSHQPDDTLEIEALDDRSIREIIPVEYARPVRPDASGQVCVGVVGEAKGTQRTTEYENEGQWMMEIEGDDPAQLVFDTASLCRIWKAGA
jgi:transcription elongation factor SPT5